MTMRLDKVQKQVSDIEDKIMDNNEAEEKRERKVFDHECRLQELSNSLKHNNTYIIGVPKKEEREKWQKVYLKNYS